MLYTINFQFSIHHDSPRQLLAWAIRDLQASLEAGQWDTEPVDGGEPITVDLMKVPLS